MATFNKFNCFVEDLAEKVHDLGSDQLVVALLDTVPVATDATLSDITGDEVAYTYCSTRNVTTTTSSQTSGVYKLVLADLTLTATGGSIGPFRYVVLYNDTSTSDSLIGWYDFGADHTVVDTDTFEIDFDATTGVVAIT